MYSIFSLYVPAPHSDIDLQGSPGHGNLRLFYPAVLKSRKCVNSLTVLEFHMKLLCVEVCLRLVLLLWSSIGNYLLYAFM